MNLSGFDLNLLKVLDALLLTQSTTEAARRVGLSQPAASSALKRLRLALGDPLFVRQGRMLVPTEFAQEIKDPLRSLLEQTETLLSGGGEFDPSTTEAVFRVLGSDFYAELLMPKLASMLARDAPGIRIQLVDSILDREIGALEDRSLDLALLPESSFPNWVETRHLLKSRFLVVARQGHQDVSAQGVSPGATVPLDLYCALSHVLFSTVGRMQAQGDAALAALGRERIVVMTLPSFSGVCDVVSQSDLVALVPEQIARRMAPRLGLDIYLPPVPIQPVQSVMAWHSRVSDAPAHRWLRNQIETILVAKAAR